MAVSNAAEGSEKCRRKIYITNVYMRDVVKQKKASGSRCDHRKSCGTSVGIIPRKK